MRIRHYRAWRRRRGWSLGEVDMKKSWLGVGAAVLLLGGCSAYQVATFQSSDRSFKKAKERMIVGVIGMSGGSQDGLATTAFSDAELQRFRDLCSVPSLPPRGEAELAPIIGTVVVALAGVLIDAGIAKLNEYTEKKIKEFKHSYSGKINVDQFSLPINNASNRIASRTRCIVVRREVDLGFSADASKPQPAMTALLQFQPLGNRAYVLKPIYLDLAYAGARTSRDGNAIDLDFTIGIAMVRNSGTSTLVSDLMTTQNYSLRKIEIGTEVNSSKFEAGTVIPAFDGGTAATIVFAATETGDGADDFGQFKKDTESYGKVIKDFGLQQLKDVLGVK